MQTLILPFNVNDKDIFYACSVLSSYFLIRCFYLFVKLWISLWFECGMHFSIIYYLRETEMERRASIC